MGPTSWPAATSCAAASGFLKVRLGILRADPTKDVAGDVVLESTTAPLSSPLRLWTNTEPAGSVLKRGARRPVRSGRAAWASVTEAQRAALSTVQRKFALKFNISLRNQGTPRCGFSGGEVDDAPALPSALACCS